MIELVNVTDSCYPRQTLEGVAILSVRPFFDGSGAGTRQIKPVFLMGGLKFHQDRLCVSG
jgi:hypothetical protein